MLSNRKLRKHAAKFRRSERRRIRAIIYHARDNESAERKRQQIFHEGNWDGDLS